MKPCQFRQVREDGRMVCSKITEGNPGVDLGICRACPVMAINCTHLRFTLRKAGHQPILVRYGNGRSEVWDDDPLRVEFVQGACAEKVMPIRSPKQCVGCAVRCPARPVAVPDRRTPAREPAVAASADKVIPFPQSAIAAG